MCVLNQYSKAMALICSSLAKFMKFLLGWECEECAVRSSFSTSPPQWAAMSTNDRNNSSWAGLRLCFPLKNLESRVKERKWKHDSPRMCPRSVILFVHSPFSAQLFVSRAVVRQTPQGNLTTTTQAPALPMLRGTSCRKTERLTRSFFIRGCPQKLWFLLMLIKRLENPNTKKKKEKLLWKIDRLQWLPQIYVPAGC